MNSTWQQCLESAQKTALLQDGRRSIHYTFSDGRQMVEEYNAKTNELILRKWKERGTLGDSKPWSVEVGEARDANKLADMGMMENVSNPVVNRIDTLDSFQWRIRNLPYPIDTYNLSIENVEIVVRTTNKKYFKRLKLVDLERLELPVNTDALTYAHANNTLIIKYKKPQAVLEFEAELIKRLKMLKSEGDVDQCKQQ